MTRILRRLLRLPARLALAAAFGDPAAWALILALAKTRRAAAITSATALTAAT